MPLLVGTRRIVLSAPRYRANAVTFDGADYLTRGADLTGAVDGQHITVAGWVKSAVDGVAYRLIASYDTLAGIAGAITFRVQKSATNRITVTGDNAAGTTILSVSSSATILAGSWHSFAFSCDLSDVAKRHLLINRVADLATVTTYTNDIMDLTGADWAVGADASGAPARSQSLWHHPAGAADRRDFFLGNTGGGFTENGALATATSSPSD